MSYAASFRAERWRLAGFYVRDEYLLEISWPDPNGYVSAIPTIPAVLRVIRAACQHAADWPDQPLLQRAMVFDECIEFNGAGMQVRFGSEAAYGLFMLEYVRELKGIVLDECRDVSPAGL